MVSYNRKWYREKKLKNNMLSFLGFINEVQSYNQPHNDPKAQILWAKFEETDINDISMFPQLEVSKIMILKG